MRSEFYKNQEMEEENMILSEGLTFLDVEEFTVEDLLKKYNLLSKDIIRVNYHMDLLRCTVSFIKSRIHEMEGFSEIEMANYLVKIFDRCNESSPNYDKALDEQMTRLCLFYSEKCYPDEYSTSYFDSLDNDDSYPGR